MNPKALVLCVLLAGAGLLAWKTGIVGGPMSAATPAATGGANQATAMIDSFDWQGFAIKWAPLAIVGGLAIAAWRRIPPVVKYPAVGFLAAGWLFISR
jgi:hypothetical protein